MAETFAALQTLLLTLEGVDSFLQEVAELAGEIVTPPISCGITAEYDGRALTVASSDERAAALDESQYDTREGTCLQALHTGEVVDVGDVDTERRWPRYLAQARAQGLRSSLSLPLVVAGESIGAMNLYCCERTHVFDGDERHHAEVFAAQASTALALALRQVRRSQANDQLEQALASRSVIDQALGILMGQQRCAAEEAFALLRTHSQHNNQKLRTVAAELVTRVTGKPPVDGHQFESPERGH